MIDSANLALSSSLLISVLSDAALSGDCPLHLSEFRRCFDQDSSVSVRILPQVKEIAIAVQSFR